VFTLLRELARAEGITIVTCTHDRLVMELAGRVEELSDGHLITGRHGEVWEHVQLRERSPFATAPQAAAGMAEQPALSSLIGADLSQFKPASERVPHVAGEAHHDDGVVDNSPMHVLQEKRVRANEAAARLEEAELDRKPLPPEPEVPPTPEEAPDEGGRWARPRE
jgi:energy-coupling factor transporter ATP-binding protein EcfA2